MMRAERSNQTEKQHDVKAVAALIAGAFAEAAMSSATDSKLQSKDLVAAMNVLLSGLEQPTPKSSAG